ncbi:MAG: trypsin-like peptidase domain-containing protein [Deltaproteobacteria bacterium]|nr:trypsin-like peptidase domain-containing protein [Deltaproteobacteria bacterium]
MVIPRIRKGPSLVLFCGLRSRVCLSLAVLLPQLACGDQFEPESQQPAKEALGGGESTVSVGAARARLVTGDEDWDEIGPHTPSADPAYDRAFEWGKGVVRVYGSGISGGWCTGSLVGRDLILTAAHCVTDQNGQLLSGARSVQFGRALNSPYGPVEGWSCSTLISVSQSQDVALLRCIPASNGTVPGERWKIVPLSRNGPDADNDLYLPSDNCLSSEYCTITTDRLLFAPGGFVQDSSRFEKCEVWQVDQYWTDELGFSREGFSHNCDTAAGSSGAPIFRKYNGLLYGVMSRGELGHYVGYPPVWIPDRNLGGAVWKHLLNNDSNGDAIFDQAEERPHLFFSRQTDGLASVWRLDANDSYLTFKYVDPEAGFIPRAYSRKNSNTPSKMLLSNTAGGVGHLRYLTVADNPTTTADKSYGPFASHWTAMDYEQLPDGTAKLLWARTDNGSAALWTLSVNDDYTSDKQYSAQGAGFVARAYKRLSDGTGRLLWTLTQGSQTTAIIWRLDPSGNKVSSVSHGPFTDWIATGYEIRDDGTRRLVWSRSDGLVAVWRLNSSEGLISSVQYGPYPAEWKAEDYSNE